MEALHTHVLVVFEPGRAGVAAVELARAVSERELAAVTVLALVPEAPSGSRCGNSATEYNEIVREAVAHELDGAREQLAKIGDRASFELLRDGIDPPLHEWVTRADVDLVLLPARRRPLRSAKHPAAAALRRRTPAEVRTVEPR